MGIIREPEGIDFEVDSRPLKKNEKSEIISHFKKTGEIKTSSENKTYKKTKIKEKV